MGVGDRIDFNKRMKRINKRHSRLSQGYIMSVNHDGLVIAQAKPRRLSFPWRPLLFVLVGMMLFKAVLLSRIGAEDYAARVTQLKMGTEIEQVGGYILAADPITVWTAEKIAAFMATDEDR